MNYGRRIRYSVAVAIAAVLVTVLLASPQRNPDQSIVEKLTAMAACCSEEDLQAYEGDSSSVTALERMLADPSQLHHWQKAVLAFGYIAPPDEENLYRMWGFAASEGSFAVCKKSDWQQSPKTSHLGSEAPISNELAQAKLQAPIALSKLLARLKKGHGDLVAELNRGAQPSYWAEHARWSAEGLFGSDETRNVMMASQCIKGLSYTNRHDAEEYIEELGSNRLPTTDHRFLDALTSACTRLGVRCNNLSGQ